MIDLICYKLPIDNKNLIQWESSDIFLKEDMILTNYIYL